MSKPKAVKRSKSKIKTISSTAGELTDGTKILSAKTDLLDLFYTAQRDVLLGNTDKDNPLFGFVKNSFRNMSKMENEKGHIVLNTLKEAVVDTDNYFKSKESKESGYYEYLIYKTLFDWQKKVFNDKSERITLLCGRRSGKSYVEGGIAVNHCIKGYDELNGFIKPRKVLMMGLTVGKAKEVFWDNVIKYALQVDDKADIDNSALKITFTNGSSILLSGNSSSTEREKLRGGEFSLIIIDEAQSQNALRYLYEDIFSPIIELRKSQIILSGTGAITNKGFWKQITTGDKSTEWTHYTANMLDNPIAPRTALEDVLKKHGWTEDNVTFRREFLAENIIDLTRIVYPVFHKGDNTKPVIRIVIGVDYGSANSNAYVPLMLHSDGKIEIKHCLKFNRSSATDIVRQGSDLYKTLCEKYKTNDIIFVADTSHQAISLDLFNQGLPVYNAYKFDRIQTIKDIRSDLEKGDIIVNDDLVADEMESYVWKYDEETKTVIYETDDDYYHPDCLPAMRYAYTVFKQDKKSDIVQGGN